MFPGDGPRRVKGRGDDYYGTERTPAGTKYKTREENRMESGGDRALFDGMLTHRTLKTRRMAVTSFHFGHPLCALPDPTRREFVADTLVSKIEDDRVLTDRLSMNLLKISR